MRFLKTLIAACLLVFPASGICTAQSSGVNAVDQPVIDADIPAGNIVFERISNDTVFVHQDLRDTYSDWFYWALRARGCQGRTMTFVFTQSEAIGVRGPVVSLDCGKTYGYADAKDVTKRKFTYTFPEDAYEVWMCGCFPYTPDMWESFVEGIPASVKHDSGVLCKGRKGSDVPYLHIGKGKNNVVITARHHCAETPGTFVMEGIVAAFAEKSKLGRQLRRTFDLTVVPFVDYDGAADGDQGKNRKPHDHNRDYNVFIYPETRAVAQLMKDKAPVISLDLHAPMLRGETDEFINTPMKDPKIVHNPAKEARFSALLERNQEGGLRYKASDDIQFGTGWNNSSRFPDGMPFCVWALTNIPSLEIGRTFEIPFSNANGAVVTPTALKLFGHSIARTMLDIVNE